MLVHVVLFWLKPDLTEGQQKTFREALGGLLKIPGLRLGHIGTPSATNRPVIDRSYSYCLTVVFDDMAGHDAYQVHPLHLAFLEQCKTMWSRVQIYDPQD